MLALLMLAHWHGCAVSLTVLDAWVVNKLWVDGVLPHQWPHLSRNLRQQ
jgi:hypothetical protein